MAKLHSIASGLAVLAISVGSALAQTGDPSAKTLRGVVGDRLQIGTAMVTSELDNPQATALAAAQFNTVTAGNEFKPDALQRVKGTFTFERADRLVAFAQKNNMKVIGHTLLWHNQAPKWLFEDGTGKPLPREEALANLKGHITGVLQHFKGKVVGWDVVNEAISDSDSEYLRNTPAKRAIGDDYIVQAFKFAAEADPDVELYYNDYNIDNPGKRERALRLVRELKAAGVRLDAVGIQGHWMIEFPDVKVVDDAIAAFAAEGVKVMITEMDIDVLPRRTRVAEITTREQGADPYTAGLPPEMQQKLADRYGALFDIFVKHVNAGRLTRVTFWGSDDGHSWLNDFPVRGRTNHALLFARDYQPKPAFDAVLKALLPLAR